MNLAFRILFIAVAGACVLVAPVQAAAQESLNNIAVVAATYGGSCKQPHGNRTESLSAACNGKRFCNYSVDLRYGDPAPGCAKDFVAEWRCGAIAHTAGAAAEALNANLYLTCELPTVSTPTAEQKASGKIAIVAATYGESCKQPRGNKTQSLASECNGKQVCHYLVEVAKIGDPAPGCRKGYVAEWSCGSMARSARLEPEAQGQTVSIACESAASLATDIKNKGDAAVYGILFDIDKTEVKPESASTLNEIGNLLKNDPALKLEVSGHTDNTGSKDHNMTLSQGRAAAVVKALTSQYGIDPKRLVAKGYGDTRPMAPNISEVGKAKNRRVELKRL